MTQSITLTASMRSNLSSLKSIQNQMDTTQNRLSTGKKVNSAIDNASSYYQSRALNNRASDLDALLDSMGQGIQTIQAANEGIEAVTAYVEQAKSVANSAFALDSSLDGYAEQVAEYQTQFNNIITEIDHLTKDASYQGINLLTGGKLTVMFNETRSHKLEVQGDDIVSKMSDRGFTEASWTGEANFVENEKGTYYKITATKEDMGTGSTPATEANSYTTATSIDQTTKYIWNDTTHKMEASTADTGTFYYKVNVTDADGTSRDAYTTATSVTTTTKYSIDNSASRINDTLDSVAKAIDYLREYSSELGNNFAIIETRQNFTDALIDVLETGSDNLVLADMNEESANYLALQTRQQLAINSLSLASQSAQSVLSLF